EIISKSADAFPRTSTAALFRASSFSSRSTCRHSFWTIREPWFLGTPAFRQRLVLNVLTTPHAFLTGDPTIYREHVAAAERSLARLSHRITGQDRVTVRQAAEVLLHAPDGRTGKDYLGYLHPAHLHSVLARGFADLTTHGHYRTTGTGAFHPAR
ncbi:hypothetical protein, partial [Kitasatospora sp. NPDC088346]|uniref:hypothetical protein n=1 Tax=Kitasatospora sp. NPDC088346 TaxID=3364073 RepID=UPI00381C2C1D